MKSLLLLSSFAGFYLLATLKDPCERIPPPPPSRETFWSGLDMSVEIASPEYERTSTLVMRFSRKGQPVRFPQASARVSCQGIRLEPSAEGYTATLRTSLRSNPEYCCDFVGGARDVAAVCIPAPERPQFAWPLDGDAVVRKQNLVVRYYAGSGTRVRLNALSGSGAAQREDAFGPSDDDGDYPLDATHLAPGAGSITLVRELERTIPAAEFQSVKAKVSTSLTVQVVWK